MASDHDYVRAIAKKEGWYFCVECGRDPGSAHGPLVSAAAERDNYEERSERWRVHAAMWRHIEAQVYAQAGPDYGVLAIDDQLGCWPHYGWRLIDRAALGRASWDNTLHVDHVTPLIDGGDHLDQQLLCRDHHKAKTARENRERAARRRHARAGGVQLAL